MEATLASGITSTTTGPYVAVQPIGDSQPIIAEVYGKALGTSGAFSITFEVQTSDDASTFTAASTHVITGTAESKAFAYLQKVAAPFVRIEVTAISGTGAALSAEVRIP